MHYFVSYESCRGKNGIPQVFFPTWGSVPEEVIIQMTLETLDWAARRKHPNIGIESFDPKDYRLEYLEEIQELFGSAGEHTAQRYKLYDA